jgi:hypothetical protein
VTREEAEARVRSLPHWYHQIEVRDLGETLLRIGDEQRALEPRFA